MHGAAVSKIRLPYVQSALNGTEAVSNIAK